MTYYQLEGISQRVTYECIPRDSHLVVVVVVVILLESLKWYK